MATDGLVVGRNMRFYGALYSDEVELPADTVLFGTLWPDWFDFGTTQEGLNLSIETEFGEILVDQQEDPARRPITGRSITVTSNLAMNTIQNMQRGIGYGTITTDPAEVGVRGHTDLDILAGSKTIPHAVGGDVMDEESTEAVRFKMHKALATSQVSSVFGLADDNAKIPVEYTALPDPTTNPARLVTFRHVLAALAA